MENFYENVEYKTNDSGIENYDSGNDTYESELDPVHEISERTTVKFNVPQPYRPHRISEQLLDRYLYMRKTGKEYPYKCRNVYLVRHGQCKMTNGKLTNLGKKQVEKLARRLCEWNIKFDTITSSKFDRAIESAEIIIKELNDPPALSTTSELNEIDLGDLLRGYGNPYHHMRYLVQNLTRVPSIYQTHTETHELFVCHCNIIYYIMGCIHGHVDESNYAHASLSQFKVYSNGRVSLVRSNDRGHCGILTTTKNVH